MGDGARGATGEPPWSVPTPSGNGSRRGVVLRLRPTPGGACPWLFCHCRGVALPASGLAASLASCRRCRTFARRAVEGLEVPPCTRAWPGGTPVHQGLASVLQPSGVLAGDPTCQRLSAAREKVPRRTRVVAKKTLANRLKKVCPFARRESFPGVQRCRCVYAGDTPVNLRSSRDDLVSLPNAGSEQAFLDLLWGGDEASRFRRSYF